MGEITAKFRERALLVPRYPVHKEMKKIRYHDKLIDEIKQFVSFSGCKTLNDMIETAYEQDIELELRSKRKPE